MSSKATSNDLPLIPPSPKDTIFKNHDILALIFSYFTPPLVPVKSESGPDKSSPFGGCRQLRNLALVCNAFSRPALDCLWTNIDGITPLLKLHPGLKVVDNKYFFLGNPDRCSTSRFYEYAKRIRGVRFEDTDDTRAHAVSLAGLSCLTQQLQGAPLTPGLKTIHFINPNCDSAHMGVLPLVLSPSVRSVRFQGSFIHNEIFRSFALPQLCSMVPSLQNLHLCGNDALEGVSVSAWEDLPDILGELQLDSLTLKFPFELALNPTFLAMLGKKLENLTELTLDCHTTSHAPSTDVMGQQLFPALKTLHLYNRSEAEICHCYPSFLVNRATCITFCTANVMDADAFSKTADTLSRVQNLKSIEIEANHHILHTALVPLLQNLSLEELHIDLNSAFEVPAGEGGTDIRCLIDTAYSGSEGKTTLRLLATPVWRDTPPLSDGVSRDPGGYAPLSTLVYIAKKAHGLERISLPIDSSVVDGSSSGQTIKLLLDTWYTSECESTLQYLDIAERRPEEKKFTASEYRDIACLLDTIFPNLESVTPMQHRRRDVDSRWDQDWELVEDYRKMRKALRLYRGAC